jgi:hypothetical protein
MNTTPLLTKALLPCLIVLLTACGGAGGGAMGDYLEKMTEVAGIIEASKGVDGARDAAARIAELNRDINAAFREIQRLPETERDALLARHAGELDRLNERIRNALSELALRDAQARRIISDEFSRLQRL